MHTNNSNLNFASIFSVCRICLKNVDGDASYDLFAIPDLAKKLQLCTSLTVEPQDGFPKNLCEYCFNRLNDLHEFQKQCVDSVQKFQELLVSNAFATGRQIFDILEPGSSEIAGDGTNLVVDDDERLTFDPLLDHKMEIENEDDVFKMLENVEKESVQVEMAAAEGFGQEDVKSGYVTENRECKIRLKSNSGVETRALARRTSVSVSKKIKTNTFSDSSESDSDDKFDAGDFNDEEFIPEDEDDGDSDANGDGEEDKYGDGDGDGDDNDYESEESDDDLPLAMRLRKLKGRNNSGVLGKRSPRKMKPTVGVVKQTSGIIECHVCHKKFKKVGRYEEHMRYHNDKLPYQCKMDTCLKGFTTANGLRLHIEHCHAETVECTPCPVEGCGRKFPRRRLLNWHLKKVHKIAQDMIRTYPCSECEKVFRCPMALKKHMYKHDGKELPFPCNICGKRFVINSALKDHLMRHAGIKNYVCPYCGVGKTTRQEWNTHINTHTQEKKFKCHLCEHSSHNKQNLRMHVKIVHEKIKDFACQYCGKTFGKSNACKMHEMTHTGEKRCECKVCGKRFLYAKGLTKHLKTHEKRVLRAIEVYRKRQIDSGEGQGTDNQGNAVSLPQLPEPKNNSKETHAKVAEEIFKVCAESAASVPKDPRRVERVDIAQLAGTAVNPIPSVSVPSWSPQINFMMKEGAYICPECGQGFNAQGNLKRHHRIVHEGVKDFACRFCHRRFAKAQTLKHHEMTHTGEKPHGCDQCGKRFIQYVALKRHVRVHLPKPPPTIPPSVYHAREELELQEREKMAAKRKAAEERAAIAKAANKELELINVHQEEQRRIAKGPLETDVADNYAATPANCVDNNHTNEISGFPKIGDGISEQEALEFAGIRGTPSTTTSTTLVTTTANVIASDGTASSGTSATYANVVNENSALADFPHINTSTIGMRTVPSV